MKCKEKFDVNQFNEKNSPMQKSGLMSNHTKTNRVNSLNTSNTSILSGSGVIQLQSPKKNNKKNSTSNLKHK